MATQLLARRGAYKASAAKVSTSKRSRPSRLVVQAYLQSQETTEAADQEKVKSRVTFQLPHHVEYGQDMCLIGEDPALGEWDVSKCVPMAWHDGDYWTAEAELPAGSKVEYKYVVRAAEDKGGDVLEWQPCWNLAVQTDGAEVTIRDAWEGESHEILEGLLPVPEVLVTEVAEETEAELMDAPAPVMAGEATTAIPPAPAATFDFPTVFDNPDIPATAYDAPADRPAAAIADDPILAEEVAAAVGETSSGTEDVLTVEQIAAPPAAAAPPAKAVGGNGGRKTRRGSTEDRNNKAFGSRGAIAAAASPKAGDLSSLTTAELKAICKERGLSMKGSRKEVLARLQQLGA